MFNLRTLALLLGVVVVVLVLVDENHGLPTQQPTQHINNQPATSVPLPEEDLQEMRNLFRELDVKTDELKSELQDMKEAAMNEMQNMTAEAMNDIHMKNEEVKQGLQDLKEAALNELQQQEAEELQETLERWLELDKQTDELLDEMQDMKEAILNKLQNVKMAIRKIKMRSEKAQQSLLDLKKTDTTRGKTYVKYDTKVTQPQGLKACERLGGRLALPTNDKEEEQIRRLIGFTFGGYSSWKIYWISGTDQEEEGNWLDSVTGEPLHYTNFKSGEPNNAVDGEHCIYESSIFPGWVDAPCDMKTSGYVCEFINN